MPRFLRPPSHRPVCLPAMLIFRLFFALLASLLILSLTPLVHAATDGAAVVAEISQRGDAAQKNYDPANRLATASEFSSLYFDVFEGAGMELDLGLKSPGLKSEIEVLFGVVNSKAMRGAPADDLGASWQQLRGKMQEAAKLYGKAEAD